MDKETYRKLPKELRDKVQQKYKDEYLSVDRIPGINTACMTVLCDLFGESNLLENSQSDIIIENQMKSLQLNDIVAIINGNHEHAGLICEVVFFTQDSVIVVPIQNYSVLQRETIKLTFPKKDSFSYLEKVICDIPFSVGDIVKASYDTDISNSCNIYAQCSSIIRNIIYKDGIVYYAVILQSDLILAASDGFITNLDAKTTLIASNECAFTGNKNDKFVYFTGLIKLPNHRLSNDNVIDNGDIVYIDENTSLYDYTHETKFITHKPFIAIVDNCKIIKDPINEKDYIIVRHITDDTTYMVSIHNVKYNKLYDNRFGLELGDYVHHMDNDSVKYYVVGFYLNTDLTLLVKCISERLLLNNKELYIGNIIKSDYELFSATKLYKANIKNQNVKLNDFIKTACQFKSTYTLAKEVSETIDNVNLDMVLRHEDGLDLMADILYKNEDNNNKITKNKMKKIYSVDEIRLNVMTTIVSSMTHNIYIDGSTDLDKIVDCADKLTDKIINKCAI